MKLHRYKSYESVLRFSDGITVDTSGPYRSLELADGWYVVGGGKLIPIKNESEAQNMISKMFRTLVDKIAYEIVFQTPDEESKVANKLLSDSAKHVIKRYKDQLKDYGIELDPNRINPVLVYDFMSDLEHSEREDIDVKMFNRIMSEWIVQSLEESFVPKKIENRRDELVKRYHKENELIKKYVLGKGQYIQHKNNFETSSSLRSKMKSNDYAHTVTSETFYFVSKKESVELPIKAVDWKIWVEKLVGIDVDENGHIKQDFEPYYAENEDTLQACLWWIGWYFEVSEDEVKREFNDRY